MPPNCSRCARWRICTWRGKNCCSWHRLARERRLLITGEPPKQAEDRKKPFHSVANKARRVYYGVFSRSKKKFRLRRKPCRISPGLSLGEPPRSQPLLCTTFPTTT